MLSLVRNNLVISAPTGAGKTVIFELAILAAFRDDPNTKVVYVAPTRSLCSERVADWRTRFGKIGFKVVEYTGESAGKGKTERSELKDVRDHRLIVTTPEKWDQLTRRQENHKLVKDVGLFCIDEVHSVGADQRGAVLEVVVSRMRALTTTRFVCVSATLPNIDDVAKWIGAGGRDSYGSAKLYTFGEDVRPCKLEK